MNRYVPFIFSAMCTLLVATEASAQLLGQNAAGWNRPNPPTPQPRTAREVYSWADAQIANQVGWVVKGSAGKDSDGYITEIQGRTAKITGDITTDHKPRGVTEVELGPDSGMVVVNRPQLIQAYNSSIHRANGHLNNMTAAQQQMTAAAASYHQTTHPNWRESYERQYQEALVQLTRSTELRNAELKFQRSLRPGN